MEVLRFKGLVSDDEIRSKVVECLVAVVCLLMSFGELLTFKSGEYEAAEHREFGIDESSFVFSLNGDKKRYLHPSKAMIKVHLKE